MDGRIGCKPTKQILCRSCLEILRLLDEHARTTRARICGWADESWLGVSLSPFAFKPEHGQLADNFAELRNLHFASEPGAHDICKKVRSGYRARLASAAVHPFRCWALVKSELSDLSGVADFTILTHHRWLSNSFDFRRLVRKLRLSKAGSVDMYATRVGRRKVGSYGWHMELRQRSATYVHGRNLWEMISKLRLWWIMVNLCMRYYEILWLWRCHWRCWQLRMEHSMELSAFVQDTVDALIYVLKGTKRVRVAGHYPGSKVTLDKADAINNEHLRCESLWIICITGAYWPTALHILCKQSCKIQQ